jgi:uncharacterized protein (TIGR00369 family)
MSEDFRDDRFCFVCGDRNPLGLKLVFGMDEDRGEAGAEVTFPRHLQGWENVVHGGMLATVLDEAMIYAARAAGLTCITGEITVRFVKPGRTGVPMKVRGRFLEDRGRIVLAESEVRDPEGDKLAWATGKLFKINPGA